MLKLFNLRLQYLFVIFGIKFYYINALQIHNIHRRKINIEKHIEIDEFNITILICEFLTLI